jgi:CheY-like chemotaxis protein
MAHLFDPFWTTKAPGEGMGMGLSVVHQIVIEHGGTVHVDSEPDRGTNFLIDLPLGVEPQAEAGGAEPASANEPVTPVGAASRSLRILIVDDEAALRRMLTIAGARRGHAVEAACEGGEALDLIRAAEVGGAPYDLVFSDMQMPGVNGRQLVEKLLEHNPRYEDRLYLFTGALDSSDISWIRAHTQVPILHKPFSLDAILRVIVAAEQPAK